MIGDNYQKIAPFDRWIFNADGDLAGASVANRSNNEARFLTEQQYVDAATAVNPLSSIMWIGDSLTWYGGGSRNPLLPDSALTNPVLLNLPNINVTGQIVRAHSFDCNYTPTGAGTLRYYGTTPARPTMTWQSPTDTEGPRVDISTGGFFYVPSGNPALGGAYLMIGPASLRPPAGNYADTVTLTNGISNNWCFLNGFSGMWEAMNGFPFATSKNYAISGATSSEVLGWGTQWSSIYTRVTVINIGVNEQQSISQVQTLMDNVKSIVRQRRAIGSIPVVMLLFPNSADTLTQKRADLEYNHLMSIWCFENGVRHCTSYAQLADWTNANPSVRAGAFSDGVHLTGAGAMLEAKYCLDPVMTGLVPVRRQRKAANQTYDSALNPHGNLLTNGGLTGTGGTAGAGVVGGSSIPASWSVARVTGSVVTAASTAPADGSPITRSDNGIVQPWWRIVLTNTGGVNGEVVHITQTTAISTSNYAIGDKVVFSGEIRISGTGIQIVTAEMVLFSGSLGINHRAFSEDPNLASQLGDLAGETLVIQFESRPFTIPSAGGALSNFIPRIAITMVANGIGTFDLGPMTMCKVP